MLALVSFIVSAILFLLIGLEKGSVEVEWGLFFLALGHVFSYVPGVVTAVRSGRRVDVL